MVRTTIWSQKSNSATEDRKEYHAIGSPSQAATCGCLLLSRGTMPGRHYGMLSQGTQEIPALKGSGWKLYT